MAASNNAQIRSLVSARRRQLTPEYRKQASDRIVQRIKRLPQIALAQTIAAYIALAGEVSLAQAIRIFHQQDKSLVLPCIDIPQTGDMIFAPYKSDSDLEAAGFGLSQPPVTSHIDPQSIDLVLVPLLAFTSNCHRIGWGKGYYDKCFSFRKTGTPPPWLVGIAFACQQEDKVQPQPWDVQLDMVITEDQMLEKT